MKNPFSTRMFTALLITWAISIFPSAVYAHEGGNQPFVGVLGLIDIGITITELGIAFSLVILGSVIASERRLPVLLAMIGVGFFAIFHGYAHGIEMPQTAQPVAYAFGFLLGAALIHITGVLIGDISKRYQSGPVVLRVGGGLIAMVGFLFIFGII